MPIEVTVRFAGTILDQTVVTPGRPFTIGVAPGVDVAVTGLLCFPLVDSSGLIRIPAGMTAQRIANGAQIPIADIAPLRLDLDTQIELAIGEVQLVLAVALPAPAIARPRTDRRPLPYLAVALALHLAMWGLAMTRTAPPPPYLPAKPQLARARIRTPPAPPPRPIKHARDHSAEETGAPRDGHRAEGQYAGRVPMSSLDATGNHGFEGITAQQIHGLIGDVDLEDAFTGLGPLYREGDGNENDFGGAKHFDPTGRPDFASIPTGRYKTVSTGRGAGDNYHLAGETQVEIELCAAGLCKATGAIDQASVTSWISPHTDAFRACWDGTETVVVDFTIANGVVRGARGRGAAGKCAAQIVSAIAFPHVDGATRVRYGVSFHRS